MHNIQLRTNTTHHRSPPLSLPRHPSTETTTTTTPTFAMLMRAIASSFQRHVTLAGGGSWPFCSKGMTAMHSKLVLTRGTSCSGAWGIRRAKASKARACCSNTSNSTQEGSRQGAVLHRPARLLDSVPRRPPTYHSAYAPTVPVPSTLDTVTESV